MATMDVDVHLGSGDLFWALFWLAVWAAWVVMVVYVFLHVMRSSDMPGWAKAVWAALILLLPVVGVLLYLCVRGARVDQSVTGLTPGYQPDRPGTATGPGPERQVADLARLRDQGVISQSEYENLRARAQA